MMVVNVATLIAMMNGVRAASQLRRRALPPPRDPTPWHALDAQGVIARLRTPLEEGLSLQQVALRQQLRQRPLSPLAQLAEAIADEFFNPLTPLLAAGAGLSALVGSGADAALVAGVVGLNALVGGVQRFRTEQAIRHLTRTTRRRALVRRDSKLVELDASKLVHGDVVLLTAGDIVPADCRIIEAASLEVDASSLTGESLPVVKDELPSFEPHVADRSCILFEGTSIATGRATAVVVAVGAETEARRGAAMPRTDHSQGGVESRLRSLMSLTGPIALGAGVGVVGGGLFRGRKMEDLVGSGVSLAVASVPEGLPLLATGAQLSAAARLSARGALVRNARCIEALGRVDVICLDKTGTLTEGRIELSTVSDGVVDERIGELGGARLSVLAAGLRATSDTRQAHVHADPTDKSLFRSAAKEMIGADYECDGWIRTSELPFEAGRSYHAVSATTLSGSLLAIKGAPEAILPRCTYWQGKEATPLAPEARIKLDEKAKELALKGLRVLAVAQQSIDDTSATEQSHLDNLVFYGFLAFSDPVRCLAKTAIARLQRAGVDVIMLTGDHPHTAKAIATELGMLRGRKVVTGAALTGITNDELDALLSEVRVFARVTPSHKVRIVKALQRAGRVVAMAGDGANDAPAIRLAHVGIAIGEHCTAAARGAADMVLADERIETIVDAIAEGRAMWTAVRDAVSILVGGNFGEIGFTLAAGLVDGRPPLHARQLILVNLLTDVAPAMAIALRPPSQATLASLTHEGPDALLGRPLNRDIANRAVITALGAGSAWLLGRMTGSAARARTIGLAALVGTQLGQTLVSGGLTVPVILTSVGSALLLVAIVQTPAISHFFGCRPLGPLGWTTALGASAAATSAAGHSSRLIAKLTAAMFRPQTMLFLKS